MNEHQERTLESLAAIDVAKLVESEITGIEEHGQRSGVVNTFQDALRAEIQNSIYAGLKELSKNHFEFEVEQKESGGDISIVLPHVSSKLTPDVPFRRLVKKCSKAGIEEPNVEIVSDVVCFWVRATILYLIGQKVPRRQAVPA